LQSYLHPRPALYFIPKRWRKAKTAEEIAALTGGDIEPIEEAFSGVRVVHREDDEQSDS
jgi:hypothetical protein